MVDYAKLVKALRCCSKIDARNNGCDSCPYEYCGDDCQSLCGYAADAIEELLAELTTIRKQLPHWISVDDRLPEVGVDVLVTDGSNVCISRQVRYVSPTERFTFWSRDDLDLTHWMPLPTPPKGVE